MQPYGAHNRQMGYGMHQQAVGGAHGWAGMPHGQRPAQSPLAGGTHAQRSAMQNMGGYGGASSSMMRGAAARNGPPRREMDSLLEELKAKQRMSEQQKATEKATFPVPADGSLASRNLDYRVGGSQASHIGAQGMHQMRPAQVPHSGGATGPAPGTAYGAFGSFSAGGSSGRRSSPRRSGGGSFGGSDDSGSSGVALFLKELPTSITEDTVCQLFGRYGVITGVDIGSNDKKPELKQGYVTMANRDSAERAKDALHDREVDGVPLWVEWAPNGVPNRSEEWPKETIGQYVQVQIPSNPRVQRIIDTLAKYVSQEGHQFEQMIMQRESKSEHGDFGFLFKHDSMENVYYRWRTFAFSQGDNFKAWRTSAFRLHEGGTWWRPPPCKVSIEEAKKSRNTNFSSAPVRAPTTTATGEEGSAPNPSAAAGGTVVQTPPAPEKPKDAVKPQGGIPASWSLAEREEEEVRLRQEDRATQERQKRDRNHRGVTGGKRLSDPEWDRLEFLLRGVTKARSSILEAMAFCLDKSDMAIEIAECITESLTIVETELVLKLARFMVVSDVLHNSSSSSRAAWAYRREFEKCLPDIMEHFYNSLRRVDSRVQADKFREQVIQILRVWEDWGLFSPQFVRGLEAALVVGARSLRLLAARGDRSREPAWLEPKLSDWRRQHFSQLEKMCRTRGLRSSTSHLEPTREMPLEDAKKEWLIDRLVAYELHWHEKEQERTEKEAAAAKAAAEAADASRRSKREARKKKEEEDLDGEAMDDLDGMPLTEQDLEGLPFDTDDPCEWIRMAEIAAAAQSNGLAVGTLGGGDGRPRRSSANGAVHAIPLPPSEFAALGRPSAASTSATPATQDTPATASSGSRAPAEDPARLSASPAPSADEKERERETQQEKQSEKEREEKAEKERNAMKDIDLEVRELRASLESQGLFRDAIEDICEEKRQRLLEEHEAESGRSALASPPPLQSEEGNGSNEEPSAEAEQPQRPKEKEKAQDKDKDKDIEKARLAAAAAAVSTDRDRDKRKEKTKEKKEEVERDTKLRREKTKEKSRNNPREKEKARSRTKSKSPSRCHRRDKAGRMERRTSKRDSKASKSRSPEVKTKKKARR